MKRLLSTLAALAVVLVLGGCAHPISLSPNLSVVMEQAGTKIDKKVGLAISEANRQLEMTTPGGGGDKVSYRPYQDLEPGLYAALSASFSQVTRVTGTGDPRVKSENVSLVLTPLIKTTSFSDSVLTWPPTLFSIDLTCTVVDRAGKPVTEVRVVGDGRASFDEFKADFSLSAKRAAEDVLKKLVKALRENTALRN